MRARLRHTVKIWGQVEWIIMDARGIPALLIGKKYDDIGLVFCLHGGVRNGY
jgi:hypothetical protein